MKRTLTIAATALGLTLTSAAAFADGHIDKAIGARQAQMKLYSFNLGPLGGMAKGEIEYDAAVASAAANNLVTLTQIDQSAMWPMGSDNSYEGSKALPAMWENFPDVMEKGKALSEAAIAMQAVAGTDLASLRGAMGDLGGACGACHELYREPKD